MGTKEHIELKPIDAHVWRSGVCWADLAESEESDDDGFVDYRWGTTSTASTATSSPAIVRMGGVLTDAGLEFLAVKQLELDKRQPLFGISPVMKHVVHTKVTAKTLAADTSIADY